MGSARGSFGSGSVRPKDRRALAVFGVLLFIGLGFWGVVYALSQNLVFFYTPTELASAELGGGRFQGTIRLSGRIVRGSVLRKKGSVYFQVMDGETQIPVLAFGLLPRLFCEGQNVVLEGFLDEKDQIFKAHRVLIKHDETYRCASISSLEIERERDTVMGLA